MSYKIQQCSMSYLTHSRLSQIVLGSKTALQIPPQCPSCYDSADLWLLLDNGSISTRSSSLYNTNRKSHLMSQIQPTSCSSDDQKCPKSHSRKIKGFLFRYIPNSHSVYRVRQKSQNVFET